jgi:hypothetical protein
VKKPSIPEYTGFEIGKTGIIPVSVLRFQYRIGNTISNTGNTETGFPVFGALNIYTDTGKILAVLPVLERIKWALLTKMTTF